MASHIASAVSVSTAAPLAFSFFFHLVQIPSVGNGAAHNDGGPSHFNSLTRDTPSSPRLVQVIFLFSPGPQTLLQGDSRSCPGDSQSKPADWTSSLKFMRFQPQHALGGTLAIDT